MPSLLSINHPAARNQGRQHFQADLFTRAAVDEHEARVAAWYRQTVATGGTCPCGAHVKSWTWTDRLAGRPEPWPRVVPHVDECVALLEIPEVP